MIMDNLFISNGATANNPAIIEISGISAILTVVGSEVQMDEKITSKVDWRRIDILDDEEYDIS